MGVMSVICFLTALALASPTPEIKQQQQQQEPFKPEKARTTSDLLYELKIAEIIPTVIDTFRPRLTLTVSWENASAKIGNTIDPLKLQKGPEVQFIDEVPDGLATGAWKSTYTASTQLTLAMTDPDAPSRDNPEWSEICHWVATAISLTDPDAGIGALSSNTALEEIVPYKPPGPPPKTGKHRYVFVALAPKNGTTEKLHLSKPADRQHWGYDNERQGLKQWVLENGLEIIGANFIYAQNEVQ